MSSDMSSISVVRATACERVVVERLLQLYLHDFSALATPHEPYGEVDANGLFAYDHLDSYFSDERREPVLFRHGDQIVGFALVNDWSASGQPVDHAVAEFFILRKHRRRGFGTRAAHAVFAARPGWWEVPVAHYNPDALAFWRDATSTFAAGARDDIAGDGALWSGTILRLRSA